MMNQPTGNNQNGPIALLHLPDDDDDAVVVNNSNGSKRVGVPGMWVDLPSHEWQAVTSFS